jgi:hypothetical protein
VVRGRVVGGISVLLLQRRILPHLVVSAAVVEGQGRVRATRLDDAGDCLASRVKEVIAVGGDQVRRLRSNVVSAGRGSLRREILDTLPEEFAGENTTAEVVVPPSGRFVDGSNRGHDSIAVLRIADNGALTRVGIYSTGGRTPRHLALDPGGAFPARAQSGVAFHRAVPRRPEDGRLDPLGRTC